MNALHRPFSSFGLLGTLMDLANRNGELLQEVRADEETGKMIVRTVQDLQPILDNNTELKVHGGHTAGYGPPSGDMKKIASIPALVVMRWLREGVKVWDPNDWPEVKRRLEDPENEKLLTAPVKLGI